MTKPRKRSSNFMLQAAILASAGLISRFFGFLYRPPMTNLIGDEGIAIYSAGYYIYTFLLILSSAGLPAAIGKMVSERMALKQYRNAHKVFQVAMAWVASLGAICMVVLMVWSKPIAAFVNSPDSCYTLISLAPTLLIVAVMSVLRGYFQGMNTMVPTAISQVVEAVFNAIFSVYLAWAFVGYGVAFGAAGGTAGTGIGALAGLIVVWIAYLWARPDLMRQMRREDAGGHRESSGQVAKILFNTAMPIIVGTAIFSITNLLDMTMVMSRLLASGAFTQTEASVLYGQLSGKYVVLTTFPVSFSTAMATAAVPSIARSVALRDKKMVRKKINVAFRIAMLISIPCAVGIGVLGDQILQMLFPAYPSGGMLLKVGSISIVFLSMCQIVTGILQGIGKVRYPAINAGVGAVVKFILNYVLIVIPAINVLGAVISTTACYIVASILNTVVLARSTGVVPDLMGGIVKPFIASCMMGVVCILSYKGLMIAGNNTFATAGAILIGMAAYFFAMVLIRGFRDEDLETMPMGKKLRRVLNKFGY